LDHAQRRKTRPVFDPELRPKGARVLKEDAFSRRSQGYLGEVGID
jgi:hypothetical protein